MNNTLAVGRATVARWRVKTTRRRWLPKSPRGPATNVEGGGSCHTWLCIVHASARVGHSPTCGGWMGSRWQQSGAEETQIIVALCVWW
jgi:hypothetical protein